MRAASPVLLSIRGISVRRFWASLQTPASLANALSIGHHVGMSLNGGSWGRPRRSADLGPSLVPQHRLDIRGTLLEGESDVRLCDCFAPLKVAGSHAAQVNGRGRNRDYRFAPGRLWRQPVSDDSNAKKRRGDDWE